MADRLKRLLFELAGLCPVKPELHWRRRVRHEERYDYQRRHVHFDLRGGARVLDIGSGGSPFPGATVLVERFLEPSPHRAETLETRGKPLVVADVAALPFADGAFDYVYCSHVLEHVPDPLAACREIMRVGAGGYLETPTFAKDALFGWAQPRHRWHVVAIARTLCFFEYSPRQQEGIRSSVWRDAIFSRWSHPLQAVFAGNQDLFNVMFEWRGRFGVMVFRLDGGIATLAAPPERAG